MENLHTVDVSITKNLPRLINVVEKRPVLQDAVCIVVPCKDIHRVLQTIQMKSMLLCFWAEQAVMGSAKAALKSKYEI